MVKRLCKKGGSLGEKLPIGGMEYPVTWCPSSSHHFKTKRSYWQHFQKSHQKLTPLYHSPGCRYKDTKISDIRRYVRKYNPKPHFLHSHKKNQKWMKNTWTQKDSENQDQGIPRRKRKDQTRSWVGKEEKETLFSLLPSSNLRGAYR